MTQVEVLAPGALTTIQDLGRPGWAHIGVPRSGAADTRSLRLANQLVGNAAAAPALETTLAGPRLRFDGAAEVALTGAAVEARIADRALRMNQPFMAAAGDELRVGTARAGLRTYVAFGGGIDVPLVLGSAATDLLTGLGPVPLTRGAVLNLGARRRDAGEPTGMLARGGRAIRPPTPCAPPIRELPNSAALRVTLGPRSDWFTDDSLTRLLGGEFTVSPSSNRIGLRLEGPVLDRVPGGELLSEGLLPGAIQVPSDRQPILLLADHPTTGGYPVIAVLHSEDLGRAAQLRPGQTVRFIAEPVS